MEKLKVVSDKGVSFIKVLDPHFPNQLQIPLDFTKICNGYMPHRFYIETSMTKSCWRVEVEKDGDGTTYLRDGWSAFAEAHRLEVGNILLFEYEEQSIFQVKIYDQNGCQKNTLVTTKESQSNPPKCIGIEEEGEDIHGKSSECKSEVFQERQYQRTRRSPLLRYSNGINKKQQPVVKRCRRSSNVGENKTSFSVFMAKNHQFTQLTIPMAVGIANNLASKDEVMLQDGEGKCWSVRLGHKMVGHAVLVKGWKAFLDGNNVAVGDTLNFEFVSDTLVKVRVIRSSEPVDHCNEAQYHSKDLRSFYLDGEYGNPQSNCVTKGQAVRTSTSTDKIEHELRCASFSFPWSKSRALTHLYIPKAIAMEQKLKNKDSVALRDSEGKYWPLEVKIWNNGQVALSKGWSEFWKGLAIKNGDTLKFEFVSPRRIQVNIHRHQLPHESNTPEIPRDVNVMDVKGSTEDLLDLADDMEVMDVKEPANDLLHTTDGMNGLASDLFDSKQEHCFLQTPPGFKPLDLHIL